MAKRYICYSSLGDSLQGTLGHVVCVEEDAEHASLLHYDACTIEARSAREAAARALEMCKRERLPC